MLQSNEFRFHLAAAQESEAAAYHVVLGERGLSSVYGGNAYVERDDEFAGAVPLRFAGSRGVWGEEEEEDADLKRREAEDRQAYAGLDCAKLALRLEQLAMHVRLDTPEWRTPEGDNYDGDDDDDGVGREEEGEDRRTVRTNVRDIISDAPLSSLPAHSHPPSAAATSASPPTPLTAPIATAATLPADDDMDASTTATLAITTPPVVNAPATPVVDDDLDNLVTSPAAAQPSATEDKASDDDLLDDLLAL
jgi:hypothetical protein